MDTLKEYNSSFGKSDEIHFSDRQQKWQITHTIRKSEIYDYSDISNYQVFEKTQGMLEGAAMGSMFGGNVGAVIGGLNASQKVEKIEFYVYLKDGTAEKFLFAEPISAMQKGSSKYNKIYNEIVMLQNKLNHIISGAYLYDEPLVDDEYEEQMEEAEENYEGSTEEIIKQICVEKECDTGTFVVGENVKNNKLFERAKKYFFIQDEDEVYAIYDATVWLTCKKGFAVTSSGLRFNYNKKMAYIMNWENFKNAKIELLGSESQKIKVGNFKFFAGEQGKNAFLLLTKIQRNI